LTAPPHRDRGAREFDNLGQIGHNVIVGRAALRPASQTDISGAAKINNGASCVWAGGVA